MKIFTTDQIRAWDAYTIAHEPITSVALMNRAAAAFEGWFTRYYPDTERPVFIIAGTGNNGGDGLAVARLLHWAFYSVKVLVCDFSGKHSPDFDAQAEALPPHESVAVHWLKNADTPWPEVPPGAVVIDALFGSGLTRPLAGDWAEVIDAVNRLPNEIVAIDLPSGLFADRPTAGPCVHAARTFSFEAPKMAFFFLENAERVGEWSVGSIGLHPAYARDTETPYFFLTRDHITPLLKQRPRFSHKGSYGHALLINGSYGKMGAAVLAAKACLRAGVGLLTLHVPACGYPIVQTAVPEAMTEVDAEAQFWTENLDMDRYSAVGVGSGIGTAAETASALEHLLRRSPKPLVLDADALNLLAQHPEWLSLLPPGSILTPHPKEFERLFGRAPDSFARNALQREKAVELGVYILLKGAFTAIACPDGTCWFNSTGNPGMATGGSGDVLTGILTGLLAQGYTPHDTCLLGGYLHGLAGDLAAETHSQAGMTAGDLTDALGMAWKALSDHHT